MPKSRSAGGRRETSRPPISIVPSSCGSRPAIARSSVVLPQPDGPRKQTNSPLVTSSETSLSATNAPKRLTRLRMRRNGAPAATEPLPARDIDIDACSSAPDLLAFSDFVPGSDIVSETLPGSKAPGEEFGHQFFGAALDS